MLNCSEPVITGRGVVSAIGMGQSKFIRGLQQGAPVFDVMTRAHRQHHCSHFIGAQLNDALLQQPIAALKCPVRSLTLSAKAALVAVGEAFVEAKLDRRGVAADRIGFVIGGGNFQQRELLGLQAQYHNKPEFLQPSYGLSYLDTDLLGILTQQFNVCGESFVVAGASASGQMALIQAARLVETGGVDVAIAVGALNDLSYWECQGLTAMGAMAECLPGEDPLACCRPFDQSARGFVFGEGCAAVVIERADSNVKCFQKIVGSGVYLDANRNPNPSHQGQVNAIAKALKASHLTPEAIDYINTHGTASVLGDQIEVQTLKSLFGQNTRINASKSLIGHAISAAGVLECVATSLQLEHGFLHGTHNLTHPIDDALNWVRQTESAVKLKKALNLSYGFSGINTALVLENIV